MQGMILIPDPLFNEPNVEQMRSTAEGDARSKAYNFEVISLLHSGMWEWVRLGFGYIFHWSLIAHWA